MNDKNKAKVVEISNFVLPIGITLLFVLIGILADPKPHSIFGLVLQFLAVLSLIYALIHIVFSEHTREDMVSKSLIHIGLVLFTIKVLFLKDETTSFAASLHVVTNLCISVSMIIHILSLSRKKEV